MSKVAVMDNCDRYMLLRDRYINEFSREGVPFSEAMDRAEARARGEVYGEQPNKGVSPVSFKSSSQRSEDHAFSLLVASIRQNNPSMTRQQAILAAARRNPELHAQYQRDTNPKAAWGR